VAHGWQRVAALTVVLTVPMIVNYTGVRRGARLSSLLALAKLLPLAFLIVLGLIHSASHAQTIRRPDIAAPGMGSWLSALLLMIFSYGGYEDALIPAGEVRDPGRTYRFALTVGLRKLDVPSLAAETRQLVDLAASRMPDEDIAALVRLYRPPAKRPT
jgi:APA family basic amino acid/polyamine antiporter